MTDKSPLAPGSRMVDVGDKAVTRREARACARVQTTAEVLARVREGRVPKGDVLRTAETAGLLGLKRTPDLLPFCHPIALRGASLAVTFASDDTLEITATARADDRTGVEMEVLTAVSVAALCVYDMLKMFDPAMVIGPIRLLEKSGGKSGEWVAPGT